MSSFGERNAVKLAIEEPQSFLQYTQRHLSRIFPAGFRIDSSNYNPMTFWTVGCQLGILDVTTFNNTAVNLHSAVGHFSNVFVTC